MQRPQIVKRVTFQLISLVVISFYMAGCSLFGPRNQSIGVSSDPPGAKVIASGKPVGTTPLHFEAQRRGKYAYRGTEIGIPNPIPNVVEKNEYSGHS